MFFRIKKAGGHEYLQVVENKRIDGVVHQHAIASLGRLDYLITSGKLASLVASGAKLIGQDLVGGPADLDRPAHFLAAGDPL
jgi:hypothetical protein